MKTVPSRSAQLEYATTSTVAALTRQAARTAGKEDVLRNSIDYDRIPTADQVEKSIQTPAGSHICDLADVCFDTDIRTGLLSDVIYVSGDNAGFGITPQTEEARRLLHRTDFIPTRYTSNEALTSRLGHLADQDQVLRNALTYAGAERSHVLFAVADARNQMQRIYNNPVANAATGALKSSLFQQAVAVAALYTLAHYLGPSLAGTWNHFAQSPEGQGVVQSMAAHPYLWNAGKVSLFGTAGGILGRTAYAIKTRKKEDWATVLDVKKVGSDFLTWLLLSITFKEGFEKSAKFGSAIADAIERTTPN